MHHAVRTMSGQSVRPPSRRSPPLTVRSAASRVASEASAGLVRTDRSSPTRCSWPSPASEVRRGLAVTLRPPPTWASASRPERSVAAVRASTRLRPTALMLCARRMARGVRVAVSRGPGVVLGPHAHVQGEQLTASGASEVMGLPASTRSPTTTGPRRASPWMSVSRWFHITCTDWPAEVDGQAQRTRGRRSRRLVHALGTAHVRRSAASPTRCRLVRPCVDVRLSLSSTCAEAGEQACAAVAWPGASRARPGVSFPARTTRFSPTETRLPRAARDCSAGQERMLSLQPTSWSACACQEALGSTTGLRRVKQGGAAHAHPAADLEPGEGRQGVVALDPQLADDAREPGRRRRRAARQRDGRSDRPGFALPQAAHAGQARRQRVAPCARRGARHAVGFGGGTAVALRHRGSALARAHRGQRPRPARQNSAAACCT